VVGFVGGVVERERERTDHEPFALHAPRRRAMLGECDEEQGDIERCRTVWGLDFVTTGSRTGSPRKMRALTPLTPNTVELILALGRPA
jgi:hypothetical protein